MITPRSNLRHLSLLCAVVRQGSISAAAQAAHLSQPAATQAIATLERRFGAQLFERNSHGMRPTEAARRCVERVARALGRLNEAALVARRTTAPAATATHGITSAQLRALIAIVETGGFGPAARTLGNTRATVHRAARQAERALGVELFEATSHGLRPTREASRFVRQAQLALAEIAQAQSEVAASRGAGHGGTVIGAMPLARSKIVPAAVLRFARLRPEHAVSILDGPYESMLDALRRGNADVLIGALREATPSDVRQEHLLDDPLAIVVRTGHPLAVIAERRARPPTPKELGRFPWIAPRPGSPLRRRFDELMSIATPAPPAAPIECNSLIAARALLLGSDRMMLLSAQQVHEEIAANQLTLLAHPRGRIARAIGLTVRRDWIPTDVQRELIDALRTQARALTSVLGRPPAARPRGAVSRRPEGGP
jgi:molybdate transport repressor ModE-like protein